MAELLGIQFSPRELEISRKVFDYQMRQDVQMHQELPDIAKQRMFDDVLININFLETALQLKDEKLFLQYAIWCYWVVASRMTYYPGRQVAVKMREHYKSLRNVLVEYYNDEEYAFICRQLERAMEEMEQFHIGDRIPAEEQKQEYQSEVEQYLHTLVTGDTDGAISYLGELEKRGMEIPDIYVHVIQEAMHRVGELWLHDKISVADELCCTSLCQMASAQFYAKIFSSRRRNRTVVVACIGTEHHEMGAKVVTDILSYGGYTCIYLGAAVSEEYVLQALDNYRPQMICLSATMPQTLVACQNLIPKLREHNSHVKIAVGGRAFQMSDDIWKKWDIDVYTKDAKELLGWAYANIG